MTTRAFRYNEVKEWNEGLVNGVWSRISPLTGLEWTSRLEYESFDEDGWNALKDAERSSLVPYEGIASVLLHGIQDDTTSEISWNDGTRTFTIQPKAPYTEYGVWIKGALKRRDLPEQLQIQNTIGNHYIYFDSLCVLQEDVVMPDINENVVIFTLYWNGALATYQKDLRTYTLIHGHISASSMNFQKAPTTNAVDPTVTDDISLGYEVGDIFINTSTPNAFMCINNAAGAALWKRITV